ncbi:hypothetical protein [Actinomadura sp. CNU-125]|nr:hypothetical protein [Actinomadura sp. CNU-125]
MSDNRSSSGGTATAPTHGMWGKQGRGYPQLAKGDKTAKGDKK